MSAPQTNIEKQKRWHLGPLTGMALVVIFAAALIFVWLMGEAANGRKPVDASGAESGSTPPEGANPADAIPEK